MTTIRTMFCAFGAAFFLLFGSRAALGVEAPLRIMPLGDSLTSGVSQDGIQGAYRNHLYDLLDGAGYNVDYVGTAYDTNNPTLSDVDHQGMSGWRVDELVDGRPSGGNIDNWLSEVEAPDVILLMIGTNDFLQDLLGWRTETVNGVLGEMDTLIDRIATLRPHAKIIVANLIPTAYTVDGNTAEAVQVQFNDAIPGLVAQHAAKGQQVSWVDMHSAVSTSDLYDGVHPTPGGYDIIADEWYDAITAVIGPKGSTNPPMIEQVGSPNDSTHVTVTFSKPVSDASANVANFSFSNGLTVSNAVLDSVSKRKITLTTSTQTPSQAYTLTVSEVRDRTTAQTLIAPQSMMIYHPGSEPLINGSFETLDAQWKAVGWTATGHQDVFVEPGDPGDPPWTTDAGTNLVIFNAGNLSPTGILSQSFPTTPGRSYLLSFDLGIAGDNNHVQTLGVEVKGNSPSLLLNSSTSIQLAGNPSGFTLSWEKRGNYAFTADSNATMLTFRDISSNTNSYSNSIDMLLDRVQVVAQFPPTLSVTSSPGSAINMTVTNDLSGNGNGATGLIRSYASGTTVTVVAPATSAGANFVKWQFNGQDIATSNRTLQFDINSNTTVNAVYDSMGSGNNPPVAVNDGSVGSPFLTVNEDSGASSWMSVLANDSDPDSDPLTITQASSADGTVSIVSSGTKLTFNPTADFNGDTTIDYTISDGHGGMAYGTVYIYVTPVNDPPVAVDDVYSGSINEDSGRTSSIYVLANDTDVDGDTPTITQASSPNGLVDVYSNRLKFTPAANFNGIATISYTITDGHGGTATASLYITVNPVNDPPVANDDSGGADEDNPATVSVLANDSDIDSSFSIQSFSQGSSGAVVQVGNDLVYTPSADFNGADSYTYTITDGVLTDTATVNITINPINDAPVATAQSVLTNEDTPLNITLSGTDVDGDPPTIFNVTVQPIHGTLSGSGANRTYTPAANYSGSDSLKFTADDGALTSPAVTVAITVNPVNDAPVAADDSGSADEDNPATVSVLANDSDVDGSISIQSFTQGTSGSVAQVGNDLVYTPSADFNGPDSFTYTITDGALTDTATVSITINPVNDPPVALAQSLPVDEDQTLDITLSGTDVENSALTFALGDVTPAHGNVTLSGAVATYTPDPDFFGTDCFSFSANDGADVSLCEATISITVNPVNDPPVARNDQYVTDEDTELNIPPAGVLANDTDDGTSLSALVVANVSHGSLSLALSGGFTYMPDPNFNGEDSFTYKTNDGLLDSNIVTVTITINEVGGNPLTEWLASYGIIAGAAADSDKDSVSNAIEYVIGGIPNGRTDADLLPSAALVIADPDNDTFNSEYLVFTYRRTERAKNDVSTNIHVEWAPDLSGPWTDADGTHNEVIIEEPQQAEPETSLVHVFIPQGPGGVLFARLKVAVEDQ